MTDYLSEMRDRIDGIPILEPQQWALASIAETLAGLLAEFREVFAYTPEDTAGETTGDADPAPSPAEPSLVALDAAEGMVEQIVQTLAAHRIGEDYHCACGFDPHLSHDRWEWHVARTAVDAMELAR